MMYGIAIKKTIPSFTASALTVLPELSNAALHMAHCALEETPIKKIQIPKKNLENFELDIGNLVSIIR